MDDIKLVYRVFEAFANTSKSRYAFICDMKTDISRWSIACVEEFGLPGVEMKGAGLIWEECIHPMDRERYHNSIVDLFEGRIDKYDMVYRAKNKSGNYVACTCTGTVIRGEDGEALYFVGTIDNHGIANEYDSVTALYTKQKLLETLREYRENREKYYILFVSAYNFIELNNVYGYEFGNKILRCFADHLLDYIDDCEVFHAGGTRFAIVSSERELKDMRKLYDELGHFSRHSIEVDGLAVTLMLGGSCTEVYDFCVDEHTIYSNGIRGLDESMYEKHGELVIFSNNNRDKSHEKIVTINAIRNCINAGCDGFSLRYQPVIGSESGKMIGAEALVRWNKDPLGEVPPSDFINWLEDDPIFYELGLWIAKNAMKQWKEKVLSVNPDLKLSINVAYTQLERVDFRKKFLNIIDEIDFPKNRLVLELTERCRLLDKTFLRNEIVYFKSQGIGTILDDFGTGFSALELLLFLPVAGIKLDKSFITNLDIDEKKQIVATAIIKCAKDIGMSITAEGIEDSNIRDMLKEYGTTFFQGYLYSKPVKIDEFMSLSTVQI